MTREEFRASDLSRGYTDLMDSTRMQTACDCAMMTMMGNLQPATSTVEAAANEFRRQGAQQVLQVLKTLALAPTKRGKRPEDNLNHKA